MPSPSAFAQGLGLVPGDKLPRGVTVCTASLPYHIVVTAYKTYHFNVALEVSAATSSHSTAEKDVAAAISAIPHAVVYSAYGSPYDCWLKPSSIRVKKLGGGGTFAVHCLGIAERNRELPTLAAAAKAAGTSARDAAAESALAATHVMKTSHFATSKCAACGQGISPGTRIAKPKSSAAAKGGWSHVACSGGGGGETAGAQASTPGKKKKRAAEGGPPTKPKRGPRPAASVAVAASPAAHDGGGVIAMGLKRARRPNGGGSGGVNAVECDGAGGVLRSAKRARAQK